MAAQSTTQWGSIVSDYGRLGINVVVTNNSDNLTCTVSMEVWYWSKWATKDTNNTLYFDDNTTSVYTSRGSVSINTTSNSDWSTNNQVKLYTYPSFTAYRGTSSSSRSCAAKFGKVWTPSGESTTYVCAYYSIPAKASYTISYNANGGSGAPSSQTKYYGTNITLSAAKPTRTGYTFKGWATSSSGSVSYSAGASYTANASVTLYAVWSAVTYTVSYNTNGGSTVSSQTKTYGTALTLAAAPTKTNYTFKGWATTNGGNVVYAAKASYTANASVTLYAVWELSYTPPKITDLVVYRCDSEGIKDTETGTYMCAKFDWTSEYSISSVTVYWKTASSVAYVNNKETAYSGTSGYAWILFGDGLLYPEREYHVKIVVTDSRGSTTVVKTVAGQAYIIDGITDDSGNMGVALGKAADTTNIVDAKWPIHAPGARITGESYFADRITAHGSYNNIGWNRFNADWIGFYGTSVDAQGDTNRRGSFKHDGSYFVTWNNSGGGYRWALSNGDGTYLTSSNFRPNSDGVLDLGNTSYRWKQLIAATTTINTSDRKVKENISEINKAKEFILGLEPVSYTRKDGDNGRIHMGFIAQDVAALAKDIKMGDMAVYQAARIETVINENGEEERIAHYYTDDTPDDELVWGLGYEEFIAPMVATIQNQQKEIDELKNLVNTLINQQGV